MLDNTFISTHMHTFDVTNNLYAVNVFVMFFFIHFSTLISVNNWMAPFYIVLSLLNMDLIFYLIYTQVDMIYIFCKAYIFSIPIDNISAVQHCAKYHVFHIPRATRCLIYFTHATVVFHSTHVFCKIFSCNIGLYLLNKGLL